MRFRISSMMAYDLILERYRGRRANSRGVALSLRPAVSLVARFKACWASNMGSDSHTRCCPRPQEARA
jgi:hypothetical protein